MKDEFQMEEDFESIDFEELIEKNKRKLTKVIDIWFVWDGSVCSSKFINTCLIKYYNQLRRECCEIIIMVILEGMRMIDEKE